MNIGLMYMWVAVPAIFFWTLVLIASWRAHHPRDRAPETIGQQKRR